MLPEKGVPSAVVWIVRRWCQDCVVGLEESPTGGVLRLQKFCHCSWWVFAAPRKSERPLTAKWQKYTVITETGSTCNRHFGLGIYRKCQQALSTGPSHWARIGKWRPKYHLRCDVGPQIEFGNPEGVLKVQNVAWNAVRLATTYCIVVGSLFWFWTIWWAHASMGNQMRTKSKYRWNGNRK